MLVIVENICWVINPCYSWSRFFDRQGLLAVANSRSCCRTLFFSAADSRRDQRKRDRLQDRWKNVHFSYTRNSSYFIISYRTASKKIVFIQSWYMPETRISFIFRTNNESDWCSVSINWPIFNWRSTWYLYVIKIYLLVGVTIQYPPMNPSYKILPAFWIVGADGAATPPRLQLLPP